MASKLQMKVTISAGGGPELAAAVKGVRAAVVTRVTKAAVAKQARKAAKVAKGMVHSHRSGQLKRSIGTVYRSYKNGSIWVYVVGPRKGFNIRIDALPKGSQKRLLRLLGRSKRRRLSAAQTAKLVVKNIDPVYYAHLVEGGRKPVTPRKKRVMSDGGSVIGKYAAAVGPSPFMGPAAEAVAGAKAEMAADIRAGIEREAAKAARTGKTIYR